MLPIQLNEHAVSIILKELVRRAMVTIRNERFTFEATKKMGYSGTMDDVFTTADTNAQAVYEKTILETLTGVGIIGEEGLRVPCSIFGHNIYVTIDPLDGTKAFVRRQSHGVATMVALVMNGEIISAWIGDVNTLEIYGYRPRSEKVHRINQFERSQLLNEINRNERVAEQYILLRSYPTDVPAIVTRTIKLFRDVHIDGGSVGTWFTRLWKGEMGAVILDPSSETPWDSTPFFGISQKLGFVFLRPCGDLWEEYQPVVSQVVYPRDHYTMVIHESVKDQIPLV